MYADGPVASIIFQGNGQSSVELIPANGAKSYGVMNCDQPNDVYNIQGMLIRRNASVEEINSLTPGFYIIGGKKIYVK